MLPQRKWSRGREFTPQEVNLALRQAREIGDSVERTGASLFEAHHYDVCRHDGVLGDARLDSRLNRWARRFMQGR
jgi:hypothetical protein